MATPLEQVESLVSADFPQHRFVTLAIARLLHEAAPEWLAEVLAKVNPPQADVSWKDYNGTPLANFLGLDRSQIKNIFAMDDADVDEVYKRLGVVEDSPEAAEAKPDEKPEPTKGEGEVKGEGEGVTKDEKGESKEPAEVKAEPEANSEAKTERVTEGDKPTLDTTKAEEAKSSKRGTK